MTQNPHIGSSLDDFFNEEGCWKRHGAPDWRACGRTVILQIVGGFWRLSF